MSIFADLPQHIYIFAALLGVLFVSFLLFFFLPSVRVSFQLSKVGKKLQALGDHPDGNLDPIFEKSGVLQHLWREYSDTLHRQVEAEAGQSPVIRLRSTMPAGAIFRSDIVVDIPLRTDFFKHLPGLFTGVGIIGTFYGLLIGLQAFQVSENPVIVRASLNQLLHGVWEAFLVSAAAIALAMVVTFIEKIIITRLNAKVEKIVQLLDGLFEGGAGEEYLARLVKASESSAGQTASLLRDELQQIMAEQTDRQIAASNASAAALGERIVGSIEESLKEPLTGLAEAFKGVRNDQNDAVQSMLSNVLESFSKQMKDLFGNQITGINNLQQQTVEALQAAVLKLEEMATNVDAAGQRGMTAMADQLSESMAAAESRQRIMNEKMAEFVDQIRVAVANSQSETQDRLQSTLSELSERMGAVIDGLSAQVKLAADASSHHQNELVTRSQEVVGEFGGQVGAVVEGVNRAVGEMRAAVEAMRNTTGDAISKINSGADTLYLAARDFAKAGAGVTGTLEQSALVSKQLSQVAGSMATASMGLSGMLSDYSSARDSMIELVSSLQIVVEQARREASMSGDVVDRIEAATAKLVAAQQQADGYLSRVSEVIGSAHESFSTGMTKAVGEANREFHQALSDSVKLLREGIQELEETLEPVSGQ
ncbi:MAG: anti-phage defense ZorAB system ZorA [Gammaproteobacteria bacterium]|nr:anti-phage defense ZorAB system ZorA [Gammaproteobacteria bacterium]